MSEEITILAIDDERDNLLLYDRLIARYMPEARIVTATSGEKGLELVKSEPPDLVLLDARMPGMNGFEVCRTLKTDPVTIEIPVLMISGAYVEPCHRLSGFEGGADGYMCKPFKAQELVAQIQALLEHPGERTPAYRVMVIDPSRTSRQVILAEIKRNPYVEPAAFANGQEAEAALDAVVPDCVICASALPDRDVAAFCTALRDRPRYGNIPIVVLLDKPDNMETARLQDAGVSETYVKPFKPFTLFKFVSRQVNLRHDWFDHEVLVVDASRVIRRILKQYLAGIRLKVHQAENANDAMKVLEETPIDLIIVDHDLPGRDGLAWCRELKASEDYTWIPIIGLSEDSALAVSFIQAGANDYLSKELIKEEIVIRAQNLLKQVSLTKQLHAAIRKEQALNEHKNKILGTAAHDIRAPIAAIAHYAEWLQENDVDDKEKVQASLSSIHELARHAVELLNKILDVASIQRGVIDLDFEEFRLDELLEERVTFANQLTTRKRIEGSFSSDVPENTAPLARGDRKRLTQVIDNLLNNAVKYCPDGSRFVVTLTNELEGWLVKIDDNGPGIPHDELPGIFDEFGKTSVRATGGEKSTGLGLAIVHKLIDLHGGTIWIDSEVGSGTSVSFLLPYHAPEDDTEGKQHEAPTTA